MTPRALILFAHGARDPRWAAPFERLQALVQAQRPDVAVHLAFLELMSPRLPELVEQLVAEGCSAVTVVPVFLGQGGHVLRDLPLMVDALRQAHPQLALDVVQAVGENAEVLDAMARYSIGALNP
jgi:sirohydrochlorin cobaltochelatase